MAKKKVNKFNPVNWNWKKIGAVAGTGLVGFAGAGAGVATFASPAESVYTSENVDTSDLASQESVDNLQTDIDTLLEEDRWEVVVEALALDELEDDDYEELREWVADEYDLTEDPEDVEDFSVSIRDADFSGMDSDDEDGVVTFDLRVRYEDNDGDRVKKFVTATVEIEDGDVESLEFEETA